MLSPATEVDITAKTCYCGHAMSDHDSGDPHPCGQCDCEYYTGDDFIDSVYVVVANEDDKVKECIVLKDLDSAYEIYHALQEIWGARYVALCSRAIGDIPVVVSEHMKKSVCNET